MALKWYIKTDDAETGPLTFRELVELARAGEITRQNLVRNEWKTDWQRADAVVGLFYMAQTVAEPTPAAHDIPRPVPDVIPDITAIDEDEDPEAVEEGEESVTVAPAVERPTWLRQLLSIMTGGVRPALNSARDNDAVDDSSDESAGTEEAASDNPVVTAVGCVTAAETSPDPGNVPSAGEWSELVDAAVERADQRTGHAVNRSWFRWASGSTARRCGSGLRVCLHLGLVIACCYYVTGSVKAWSASETQRLERQTFLFLRQARMRLRHAPAITDPAKVPRDHFPGYGACAPEEFQALLVGCVMFVGALTYGTTKLLDCTLSSWLLAPGRSTV